MLSIFYGLGCLTASVSSDLYRGWGNALYFVPVVGPLLRQAVAFSSSNSVTYNNPLVVLFDIVVTAAFTTAEALGFAFLMVGLFKTTRELVPDTPWGRAVSSGVHWAVAPLGPLGTPGLSLVLAY